MHKSHLKTAFKQEDGLGSRIVDENVALCTFSDNPRIHHKKQGYSYIFWFYLLLH